MPTTATLYAAGTPATTGATWTNPTNAAGSTSGTYATFTNAASGAVGTIQLAGYAAQTAIGTTTTPTSIDVTVKSYVLATAQWASLTVQLYSGASPIGSPTALTLSATTTNSQTVTLTGVNLPTNAQTADLRVMVTATRAANTTSSTFNLDFAGVAVTYTPNDQTVTPSVIPAGAVPAPQVAPDQFVRPSAIAAVPVPAPGVAMQVRPSVIAAPPLPAPSVSPPIRPPVRIDWWALADDGSILCPLPDVVAWDLSLIPGAPGAVRVEVPADGLNYSVLRDRVTRYRDLRVHIRTDGTLANTLGAILQARDGDDIQEQGTVTFVGAFFTKLLDEGVMPYNTSDPGGKGEIQFTNATAGGIFNYALTQSQAAGEIAGLHWSFTSTVDSNGTPWPTQLSPKFSPDKSLLDLAQQLRDWGIAEFEVTTDLEVRLYVPETVGRDHTVEDPPIVLRAGRDLLEAPRRIDVGDAVTDLLVTGGDGVHVRVSDATARARRGRIITKAISETTLATNTDAITYGQQQLKLLTLGVDELTHSLTFDQNLPTPLKELFPADWVYSDTGQGLSADARQRIVQLTVSQSQGEDHYTGGVVLNDLIAEREVVLQRQIDRLKSGSTVIGTSQPATGNGDDGKIPAAPTGLVLSSDEAFQVPGSPTTLAPISAQWAAVTTNTDGSIATDVSKYAVRYAYLGSDQVGGLPSSNPGGSVIAWQVPDGSPTGNLTLTWGNVEGGREVGVQVAAIDASGNQGPWSTRVDITTAVDDTPPPVPSTPIVDVWFRTFNITWNGLGSAGEVMPDDFNVVQVWISQTAAFAVPAVTTDPTKFDPASAAAQHVADLSAGGTWNQADIPVGVGYYFRFVSVDRAKNPSTASAAAGPFTAEQLVTQDLIDSIISAPKIADFAVSSAKIVDAAIVRAKIADLAVNNAKVEDLQVGKITTGTLVATVTLSGIIRTAATGARVEMDAAGVRLYNTAGTQTVNLAAATGAATITGTLQSALSGKRWVMTTGGDLYLYPAAGTNASRMWNLGNDLAIRGVLDSNGYSGRLNVNAIGVGVNFSAENDLGNLLSEILVSDRSIRSTATNHYTYLDGRYSPVDSSGARFYDFMETNSSGTPIVSTRLRYSNYSGQPTLMSPAGSIGFRFDPGAGGVIQVVNNAFTTYSALKGVLTNQAPSSRTLKTNIRDADDALDGLGVLGVFRGAQGYGWNYKTEAARGDAPQRFGPMIEDLPEMLVDRTTADGANNGIGALDQNVQVGLIWTAICRIVDILDERAAA